MENNNLKKINIGENLFQTKNKKQKTRMNKSAVSQLRPTTVKELLLQKLKQYKKIRMFGSAAISLSYVALGRVDAYFEQNIKLWDVAAGIAILKALNKTPNKYALKEDYLVDLEISN